MIVIVDYDSGNIGSVKNMIKKAGGEAEISGDADKIRSASKLVLPGVGAFDHGMRSLRKRGLVDCIREKAESGSPIVGICLGMQLLGSGSDEGVEEGLGLIPMHFRKFQSDASRGIRVPHVGWNTLAVEKDNPLIPMNDEEHRYYFVHSYYADCEEGADVLGRCTYGHEFAAAVSKDQVFGFQFHAEKSHRFGLDLFERFVAL